MTVPNTLPLSGPYTADGTNRDFDFTFKITEADQLVIVVSDDVDGLNAVEITSGYEVPDPADIGSDNGGTVRYPVSPVAPLAAGKIVNVLRAVDYAQETQFGNQGGFHPQTHEKAFDNLAMQIQQLAELMSRAVVAFPGTDPTTIIDALMAASADAVAAALTASGAATAAGASEVAAGISAAAAAAAAASIQGIPAGGTAGQVLAKTTGTSYDVAWTTPQTSGENDAALAIALAEAKDAVVSLVNGYADEFSSEAGVDVSTPNYANPGGTGNRTASITVTHTLAGGITGTIDNLVDGASSNSTSDSIVFSGTEVAGNYIQFDFGSPIYFTEFLWRQVAGSNVNTTHGTWKWMASNTAGSGYADVGTSFTLGGGAAVAFPNTADAPQDGRRYWRLVLVSGTGGVTVYCSEIEFKIAAGVQSSKYAYNAASDLYSPTIADAWNSWNPLDKAAAATLSNGNLTLSTGAGTSGGARAVSGYSAGKHYWEYTITTVGADGSMVGFGRAAGNIASYPGADANGWSYYYNGQKYTNNANVAYGAAYTSGDVISVLLDMDAGTATFWKNGVSQGQAFTGLTGTIYPWVGDGGSGSSSVVILNTGGAAFAYTPPAGYALRSDMVLQGKAVTAPAGQSKANLALQVRHNGETVVANTDLKGWVARDGSTFVQGTLVLKSTVDGNSLYEANNIDLSATPAGTAFVWKAANANGKNLDHSAVCLRWGP